MKRLTPDPWIAAAEKYKIDQKVTGTVTRITPFGAFVKLDDEIDGLIHVSELTEVGDDESGSDDGSQKGIQNLVDVGSEIEACIVSIDVDDHRLGLSIKALSDTSKKKSAKKEDKKEDKDDDVKSDNDNKAKDDDSKNSVDTSEDTVDSEEKDSEADNDSGK